jgi:starch phosphorylase
VVYFCAEFAVHDSIPIYSGGLGILAGDHLKSASDLGIPLVGVGLLYQRGYFDQAFDKDGWQINRDEVFDPARMPLKRLHTEGGPGLASVELEGRTVELGAWEMWVGRTRVILLDADLPANDAADRDLTARLYEAGEELRLKQEWILGTGGVRVLEALAVEPGCWHANEGHAAFMMVERARRLIESGSSIDEAIAEVRRESVFTTHTPVPAGHDNFTREQVETIIGPVWATLGMSESDFLQIGFAPETGEDRFHMTAAAIRLSQSVNGVSKRHGRVTREMWNALWPDRKTADVPIGSVTNGVHAWTWMSEPVQEMLDDELGAWWNHTVGDPESWDRVLDIDDARIWQLHREMKRQGLRQLINQARRRWAREGGKARHVVAAGPLLDPEALTFGFARRFATYKRADLLLRDEERLLELITNERRPVQLVFAGKAHPADDHGKRILQRIYQLSHSADAGGRVAFVQDYEMHVARALFNSVDVWLNIPRVPKEASGTSGMKAALNLVPQLGTIDGWWEEGYTGMNGWAMPRPPEDCDDVDEWDWEHFFGLLEDEVVPMYHDRDADGVPRAWVERMKHALWVAGRDFTTSRMLRDYATEYYLPTLAGSLGPDDPPTA